MVKALGVVPLAAVVSLFQMRYLGDLGTEIGDWNHLVMIFLAKHFKANRMQDH